MNTHLPHTLNPLYAKALFGFVLTVTLVAPLWASPAYAAQLSRAERCSADPEACQIEKGITPESKPVMKSAQWGKGSILAVAFAPDGRHFVVGSGAGFAVYDVADLARAPRWLQFDEPFWYDRLNFSTDGNHLRLENWQEQQIRSFSDAQLVKDVATIEWPKLGEPADTYDVIALSPDKTKRFRGATSYEYSDRGGEREVAVREVYDLTSHTLLYTLSDPTRSITLYDYHEPEGCELSVFSYCGNAYAPVVYGPYRAHFAPSSESFAVIYRVRSLGSPRVFSTLRVYAADDGKLLGMLGSLRQPVVDFAYAPNSASLLVAFDDGSIQLWDIPRAKPTFHAWQFDEPIVDVMYTHDGEFVLIQRPNRVEVRRRSDGAILARYDTGAFALSPVENLVALTDEDGVITLRKIDTGEIVREIQAHTKRIFALAFSPDGRLLASSSQDCTIRLWDVSSGKFLHFFEQTIVDAYGEGFTRSRIFIRSLRFIAGANALVGFGSWGTMVNWNVNSGASRYVIESAPLEYYNGMMTLNPHFPASFGVDPTTNRFYIGATEYDLQTGEKLGETKPRAEVSLGCPSDGLPSLDGTRLFGLGEREHKTRICVMDAKTKRIIQTVDVMPAGDNAYDQVGWLTLSPDGRQLILPTWSGRVFAYQVNP